MTKRIRLEVEHPTMVKRIISDFEEDLDELLLSFTKRPENLTEFNDSIRVAIYSDAVGEPDELTIQYLQLSLQLGVAHFISAIGLSETFGVWYLGKTYPYALKPSKAHLDANLWLKLTFLAIVLRNGEALQIMCSISTDALREANAKPPESSYYLVDFIKGLFDENADVGELLFSALESTEDTNYMLNIRVPLLSL